MPPQTNEDRFRTHVIIDEAHHEAMKTLRHEIGSTSAVIRSALDEYLPAKMSEVNQRISDRKRQTVQALQLQEDRLQVDQLEGVYQSKSEDFKTW